VHDDLQKSHVQTTQGLHVFLLMAAMLVISTFNLFMITHHTMQPHHEQMNTRMTLMELELAELEECVAKLILACEQAEKELP
jgi:hypothetical protein